MARLAGKVAVITGAGRGLGREYALLFAREGAQVVVNDPGCERDGSSTSHVADEVVGEITAAGGDAVADTHAVGTKDAAEALMQTAVETFGRLDVLVNNAGILRDRTILNMTEDEWDAVIQVHLKGTFTCLQAAARIMKEQPTGGRIINTSSSSGLLGNFGQANYGAAKAGIYALTRIAAIELAKHKITVNAVAPAAMTRMLATMPGMEPDIAGDALSPDRVAPLVAYLATDEAAAARVTGMTIGAEGNELFAYRMLTSHGVTRYESSPWTIDAVEKAMQQILHW